jgi:hypothetical protein
MDRALKCGFGAWRVLTAYDDDSPDTFDQEIRIVRFLHQDAVLLDPAAEEPDWSDGKFAFVRAWLPIRDFKRQFPGAETSFAASNSLLWEGMDSRTPDWVRGGYGADAAVLVAEYWFKVITATTVEVNGQKRTREDVKVYVCKMTGTEVLEAPQLWPGRLIPIIPILGTELQPFDDRRRFSGMITDARDAQRFYNYSASSFVEGMALEPKAPWVMPEGQDEGHEEEWQQSNVRNFPVLHYKPTALGEKLVPPPQRAQVDGSRMNLAALGMNEARGMIQQTTAVHEASLGSNTPKDERSGRALLALQGQADMSNGGYLANLEIAMAYEARVVLDLMPHIYDRSERVTRIIRGDDQKSEQVMLNAPFTVKDGRVVPAQKGDPNAKMYDLASGARYGVSIDVGRSHRTRLQEGDEFYTSLLEARPDVLELFGDIMFQFKDVPGAKEVSKRLAKVREEKYPGLGEGEDGQMPPEQMQARAQALQQENAQLKQQLQGAAQALQTDQAKQQAQIAKAQMDTEASLAKTRMETESRETIAAAQEETKRLIAGLEARIKAAETLFKAAGAREDRETAETERREGRAHEVGMAAAAPPTSVVQKGEDT